jgi:hypothetical protein
MLFGEVADEDACFHPVDVPALTARVHIFMGTMSDGVLVIVYFMDGNDPGGPPNALLSRVKDVMRGGS